MEKFIRYGFDAEKIPFYNCSINGKTEEDWYAEGTVSYVIGGASVVYGFIAEFVYTLVMTSMWKLHSVNSCYKIMIFLGFYDMAAIVINSIITGYFWIYGGCYCTNPNLNFIAGSWGLSLWCGACILCFLLVTNRICDLWNKSLARKLFSGWKLYLWFSLPVTYTLYFLFLTPPVLFNSDMTAWFFSPMITKTDEETTMFHNYLHTFNNLLVVAVTCSLYIILSIIIDHKYGGMGKINKLQRSIIVQSCLICMANFVGSLIYVYMNFFPTPRYLILFGHVCWMAAHGIPAFVYLLLNKTIRDDVISFVYVPKNYLVSFTSVAILKDPTAALHI